MLQAMDKQTYKPRPRAARMRVKGNADQYAAPHHETFCFHISFPQNTHLSSSTCQVKNKRILIVYLSIPVAFSVLTQFHYFKFSLLPQDLLLALKSEKK